MTTAKRNTTRELTPFSSGDSKRNNIDVPADLLDVIRLLQRRYGGSYGQALMEFVKVHEPGIFEDAARIRMLVREVDQKWSAEHTEQSE